MRRVFVYQVESTRFEDVLMEEKAITLPYQDLLTVGVNVAIPIIGALCPPSQASPMAKSLISASDMSRFLIAEGRDAV